MRWKVENSSTNSRSFKELLVNKGLETLCSPGYINKKRTDPSVLQRTGRRTGENKERRRKRVCVEAGSQKCTLCEAGLNRTDLECAGEKFHMVWSPFLNTRTGLLVNRVGKRGNRVATCVLGTPLTYLLMVLVIGMTVFLSAYLPDIKPSSLLACVQKPCRTRRAKLNCGSSERWCVSRCCYFEFVIVRLCSHFNG